MKDNVFSKILSREKEQNLVFWVVSLILFLPVIILPPYFQASDWSRVILFRIILTSLIAYLFYRFFYKKDFSFSLPRWNLKLYLPVLALLGFWLASIIATIFSQDRFLSFFGSPTRAGGTLNLSFIIIFALMLAILIKGEYWEKLMKVSFTAGILASFLAIIQYFGLFKNIFLSSEAGATPSFLGNSTFLAMYMIFMVFSSFNFLILKNTKKQKIIYGLLFFLFLFTIFVTSSRAAFLGLLVGFAFYSLFYSKYLAQKNNLILWLTPKRLKIFKATSLAFIILVLAVLFYVNLSPKLPYFIKSNDRLSFFVHNRLSFNVVWQDLTGTRLSAWKITLKSIKERPILGWGPENFHIGFEKYFDPTLPPSLQRIWWDKPHNIFLEIWASYGILALLFYIAFWTTILWQLQKIKKTLLENSFGNKLDKYYIAHGLQAVFIAYLVVLFFNFDSFPTYLISSFFIGYAFYLIFSDKEKKEFLPPAKEIPALKFFGGSLLLVIILFFWFWGIKPLYLNEKIVEAKNFSEGKQCKKAFEIANSSNWAKSGIIKPYAALVYSDIITKCTYTTPEKEVENAKKGFDLLNETSKIQKKYSRTWILMASLTNILAARQEDNNQKGSFLAESREYLNRALELSPKRQEVLIELEKTHLLAEDYESMEKTANDCIAIDSLRPECYWYLGIAQIFTGNQEEGKKNISLSKEKGYNDPPYIQLGAAYLRQKNYKDAIDAYINLIAIYPERASYHSVLALLYKEVGEFDKARTEAIEVFKLQPEDPETIEFIKLLIGLKPGDISLHYALVDIYRSLGDREKMREELLKIMAIYQQLFEKESNSVYRLNLAYVYNELGEYQKAFDEAMLTLRLAPERIGEVEDLIRLLPSEGKYIEQYHQHLVPIYRQMIAREPNSYYHRINLAYAYKNLGEYQKAFDEAIAALTLAPERVKEVEHLIQLLPYGWTDKYNEHFKQNPALYFEVYGKYPN